MSKQQEADLILKLYDLRREATMRKARDWYFREFHPDSEADIAQAMYSEQSGYLRMVTTYWDMAATLVNHGAIDLDMFNDANGEQLAVFAKIELFLPALRNNLNAPQYLMNLEKLIDATPEGRQKTAMVRERLKQMRAHLAARRTAST